MKERSIHEFADKKGAKRRVIHSPGALGSWDKAAAKLKEGKAEEIEGFLIGLFDSWVHGSRFHKGWARAEGDLNKSTKFFAIKRIPIRAYFWYSVVHKDTIVISHYVCKKWQKLRPKDIRRVKANWKRESSGN